MTADTVTCAACGTRLSVDPSNLAHPSILGHEHDPTTGLLWPPAGRASSDG